MSEYIEETVQELLKRGKNKGELTFTEVIDALFPSNPSVEIMDSIYDRLEQQGLYVREQSEEGLALPEAEKKKNKENNKVDKIGDWALPEMYDKNNDIECQDVAAVEKGKAVRLIEYLIKITDLQRKTIKVIDNYQQVLWFSEIPRLKGCFTQAWCANNEVDDSIWLEIQTYREPPLPKIPNICRNWVNPDILLDKTEMPFSI